MILVVDHYDSFTFNIVHCLGQLGAEVAIRAFDQFSLEDVDRLGPSHILVSPGPGRPESTGVTLEIIQTYFSRIPILGVCLGHQAIAVAFGATILHAPSLVHGKSSVITHDGRGIFEGLAPEILVGRYHSLVVDEMTLPSEFLVSARTTDGVVMGIRHRELPVEGIQFHPESVLTPEGLLMLGNFLKQG